MGMKPLVAYFCTEFGIEGLPFGGGLGILAGDFIKSCAKRGLPVVGVGLLYSQGNFHQRVSRPGWREMGWYGPDGGVQTEYYEKFDPTGRMELAQTGVRVPIMGEEIELNAWRFDLSYGEKSAPIIYLDTNTNSHRRPWDEDICNVLYPDEWRQKLAQFQVLGLGGVRTLETLGYDVKILHLNEGHAALATLADTAHQYKTVFTTHTPVEAGIPRFTKEQTEQVLGHAIGARLRELTGSPALNTTRLAMASAYASFGVSPLHALVSRHIFRDYPHADKLFSIDNGIHIETWAHPEVQKLFDSLTAKEWRRNPRCLERVVELDDEQVLHVHRAAKERLVRMLLGHPRVICYSKPDPDQIILGYARRITEYKQATLIFDSVDRLRKLGTRIQIVFAGKAHPDDEKGKQIIQEVFAYARSLEPEVSVSFVEDYDADTAKLLVRGCDVWLNTPMLFLEASGTSGMKAAANFVPTISTLDGWVVPQDPAPGYKYPRGLIEGVTGWGLGRMPKESDLDLFFPASSHHAMEERAKERRRCASDFVDKLETVVGLFRDRHSWARIMKQTAAYNAPWFNSDRMAEQYFEVYGL